MKHFAFCIFLLACFYITMAQQVTITGKVVTRNPADPLSGISVTVKGTTTGTSTDEKGSFSLNAASLPVTLIFTSVIFQVQEVSVNSKEPKPVTLEPLTVMGTEIVLSANRVRTRILDAPVSIEQYGSKQIINSPTDYYSYAAYKKGIDMTTSSMTFKTISTRGFNGSGSTRVNQLVDGMDNQAPGLNFPVGNFAGLTELDVENVEILPGASSALYGPGGMNGTILITSKDPFKQGLSVQIKQGLTNTDKIQRGKATSFQDYSLRYAKALSDRFAFRISAQYISGTDWLASDSSNYLNSGSKGKVITGNRASDPNYNGVNVYGDETSVGGQNLKQIFKGAAQGIMMQNPAAIPAMLALLGSDTSKLGAVSRTGYNEKDVIDPKTMNVKLSASLMYKLSDKLRLELMGYWGTGNTVYTGNNRYALKDIKIGQYKLELKHRDWMLRSYTTQENAGESYSATVAMQVFNEGWKQSFDGKAVTANPAKFSDYWYGQYSLAYWQARLQGKDMLTAHNFGRSVADKGRPVEGSQQFNDLFNTVRKTPIPNGGLFLERSQLWMTEGQYNFSNAIKFAEIIVGANWKKYVLNSEGTLFIDTLSPISINEYGAYGQISKKLLSDRLTLSFSGRFDKNEDFKTRFTPRATALVKLAENNNLRLSYQTAYRFPSTQQKYIRLNVGGYTLLGGLPWIVDYLQAEKNPLYELDENMNPTGQYSYKELNPESVSSFEIGYKGLISKRLLVDVYAYAGQYENFLGRKTLFQPSTGKVFSIVENLSTKVKTHGFGLGFDYMMAKNYSVFINAYSDVIGDIPVSFTSYFNAPKYRVNAGFANAGLGKKKLIGFNVMMHWQDSFMWDGELANGPINAFATVDAQISYKIAPIHSTIKIGGTNVFNNRYKNAYANPELNGLYYVSFGYNLF
ncbi:MAG: TonB-dependent receptor [Flavisolibacter sp.]